MEVQPLAARRGLDGGFLVPAQVTFPVRVFHELHRGEPSRAEVPQPTADRVGDEIQDLGNQPDALAVIKGNQRIRRPHLQRFDLALAHDIQECPAFVGGQEGAAIGHAAFDDVLCSSC